MKPYALLLAIMMTTPALAAENNVPDQSLFFSPDEAFEIEAQTAKLKPEHHANSGIHLGAVLYYGPDDWTLWLQGQRWTPETDQSDLHVVTVEPNLVHLSWAQKNGAAPRDIALHPHQTYQYASGRIVEGER